MRIQDIEIGKYYRLKGTNCSCRDYYGWVKVLEVYKKGQYNSPDKTKNLIKCEHIVHKDDTCGFVRYFRPMDLVKVD